MKSHIFHRDIKILIQNGLMVYGQGRGNFSSLKKGVIDFI